VAHKISIARNFLRFLAGSCEPFVDALWFGNKNERFTLKNHNLIANQSYNHAQN
jgi:hypothetical protein